MYKAKITKIEMKAVTVNACNNYLHTYIAIILPTHHYKAESYWVMHVNIDASYNP